MARALAVLFGSLSAGLSRSIVINSETNLLQYGEQDQPGCYVKIPEKSSCANRELADKYKDWVLEKDVKSRTPHGCRGVADRLDLKCSLGFGSVQTSFKPGPRDAKITAASELIRGKKAADDQRAVMERQAAANAEAEAKWQAEGEAQVQRQVEERKSELKRREEELAQVRAEEKVNAERRKAQEAKRQEQEDARERSDTLAELDEELEADARRQSQAEADLQKAQVEAQKAHARAEAIYAAAEETRAKEEFDQQA